MYLPSYLFLSTLAHGNIRAIFWTKTFDSLWDSLWDKQCLWDCFSGDISHCRTFVQACVFLRGPHNSLQACLWKSAVEQWAMLIWKVSNRDVCTKQGYCFLSKDVWSSDSFQVVFKIGSFSLYLTVKCANVGECFPKISWYYFWMVSCLNICLHMHKADMGFISRASSVLPPCFRRLGFDPLGLAVVFVSQSWRLSYRILMNFKKPL